MCLQKLEKWQSRLKDALPVLSLEFHVILVWFTLESLAEDGINHIFSQQGANLLVVDRHTMPTFMPALADRIIVLDNNLTKPPGS